MASMHMCKKSIQLLNEVATHIRRYNGFNQHLTTVMNNDFQICSPIFATQFFFMKVFKFGGASVSNAERIRNVGSIVSRYRNEKLLIVVSAMGKTTNALEKVAEQFYKGNKTQALELFNQIKKDHLAINDELTGKELVQLADFFTEVEWLLHDKPVKPYDYYYDQIVCVGELLSTAIVSNYLLASGIGNQWLDVRDIVRTDNTFRDAKINWDVTSEKVNELASVYFDSPAFVLTQGFIGATDENESTTLGREGSDYTAAVFANLLNAESLTIWKDVQGVMNADPKLYKDAEWIRELNYKEVIEMAFYGAQVIHPKTIKPLQNKNIPLVVRSFIHPDEEGTTIHNNELQKLPPIIVYKKNQVLIQLITKDFSFIGEGLAGEVYKLFRQLKWEPNLTQNAAISILCVLDDHTGKLNQLTQALANISDIEITSGQTLLTIRHFENKLVQELTAGHKIILQQQTPETIQMVYSEDMA